MDKFSEIRQLNNIIITMRDKNSSNYNQVNYPVWPELAALKKSKKNYLWAMTIGLCGMAVVILWILLFEIVNPYWIGGSTGLVGAFILYCLIRLIIVLVKLKRMTEEWNKELKPIEEKNQELNNLYQEAIDKMNEVLKEANLYDESLHSYDDVYEIYNNYVNSLED